MKNEINLYPMNYDLLVQFRNCRLPGELPMDTIDRLTSDKNVNDKAKKIGKIVREYCDDIPYHKANRREFLNAIVLVADVKSWERYIPYRTTKFGHQGKKKELKSGDTLLTYQPISSKKIVKEAILTGLYPISYFQTRTQRRKGSKISQLSVEEQESREKQFIQFIDHGTLVDHELNAIFLEIFEKTGLLPIIEMRNAHSGTNACFLIVSLMDAEAHSFGLKSTYSYDSKFGVRIEHRGLGDDYHTVSDALKKISMSYGVLLDYINRMQSIVLTLDEQEVIKEILFEILFGNRTYSLNEYECDLSFLFENNLIGPVQNMWERMITIQKALNHRDGIPYTYVNTNGKTIHASKRLRGKKTNQITNRGTQQKILAQLFELFIKVLEVRT